MASRRIDNDSKEPRRPPPASPDEREQRNISLAEDLAERQLRSGEASAQVITHYLKLGSSREQLEQARLEADVQLQMKKMEMMESAKRMEDLYENAINAMRSYAGQPPLELPPEGEEQFYE